MTPERSGRFWKDAAVDDHGIRPPIPILRMYDVEATKRFYLDYLGFDFDWHLHRHRL